MDIPIIHENSDYLVINKPAGLVVHSDGKTKEQSLTDWLLKKYPKSLKLGEPLVLKNGDIIPRPGIVHRLDRETSGAMIIAKNQKSFEFLKNKFKNHEMKKRYHVFVHGSPKKDDDTIDRPIGRSRKDFRKWSAQRGARGELRDAITNYNVLKRSKDVSLLEAMPKTGRTHQIRVHFKAINHPVVSDSLYAPKHKPLLGLKRVGLHSRSLSFKDKSGKEVTYEADYPEDFAKAMAKMEKIAE